MKKKEGKKEQKELCPKCGEKLETTRSVGWGTATKIICPKGCKITTNTTGWKN